MSQDNELFIASALAGITKGLKQGMAQKRQQMNQDRNFKLESRRLDMMEERARRGETREIARETARDERAASQESRAQRSQESVILSRGQEVDESGKLVESENTVKQRAQTEKVAKETAELDRLLKKANIDLKRATAEEKRSKITSTVDKEGKKIAGAKPAKAKEFKVNMLRAAGFGRRAELAEEQLEQFIAEDPFLDQASVIGGALNAEFFGIGVPEGLKPDSVKTLNSIKQGFIMSSLRLETGAQVNKDEFEKAEQALFPRPGDGPDIIRNKKEARMQVLANLKAEAGGAYDLFPKVARLPQEGESKLADDGLRRGADLAERPKAKVEGLSELDIARKRVEKVLAKNPNNKDANTMLRNINVQIDNLKQTARK